MLGRRRRAAQVQEAMGRTGVPEAQPQHEYGASDEVLATWGNFYSDPKDNTAYAERVLSYTALRENHEKPVRAWREGMERNILPWVEHNAPDGELDALLAFEMPNGSNDALSGGAFVMWGADGSTRMYGYALEKGESDPDTGTRQLKATILTQLEVNGRTRFPAPQGAEMVMSVRGRAHQYDGAQIEETAARQSYQRSFTAALREAVAQNERDNDPQLPTGTDRYIDNMGSLERRMMLAKRYYAEGLGENVFEVVTSRTITDRKGEYASYYDLEKALLDINTRVDSELPGSSKMGDYLVERPHTQGDVAKADYVVVNESGAARRYDLQITADGSVVVERAGEVLYRPEDGNGLGQLPRSARITSSVRGFSPARDNPYGKDILKAGEERTDEELRMMRVRDAVTAFDAQQQK